MIIVQGITQTEQRAARNKMEEISAVLAKHEKRDHWTSGTYVGDYAPVMMGTRKFIVVPSPIFKHLLFDVLPKAIFTLKDNFGKHDANLVIRALYDTKPMFTFEEFKNNLQTDKFAYIFEMVDEQPLDKVIRVELFRQIKPNKDRPQHTEFIGGIFHAFQHFSFANTPLSTHQTSTELVHPVDILEWIIKSFFISTPVPKNHQRYKQPGFETLTKFNDKHNLEGMYYHESVSNTYFLARLGIRNRK